MATEYGGTDSNISSGSVGALDRQPTVFDYAQSNQFKLYLSIFPKTEWFVVRANVPGVNLGQASQPTPLVDMPLVGDKITYDPFNMTFLIDEQYQNYIEMYSWMMNIGFPYSTQQFNKLERPDNLSRPGNKRLNAVTGKFNDASDRDLYSDIQLSILTSKNNMVAKVTMYEAFPVSLGSLEYSQQELDTDYLRCDVSFAYSWFDVKKI